MSPRRNRPPRVDRRPVDPDRVTPGVGAVESWGDQRWRVRQINAGAARKAYRCPGCDQEIRPGVGHLVAWPLDDLAGESDRRHWHTGCWWARDRRRPTR